MAFRELNLPDVNIKVGRVRVTKAVSPGEPGYIRSMRIQTGQLEKIIKQVVLKVHAATAHAIVYALQPIFDYSQEIVPVESGDLKRSGYLKADAKTVLGKIRAQIGYALYGKPHYAAFVHEMLHIPHQKGKQAKYLEAAVHQKLDLFRRRLVRRTKELAELDKNG